MRFNKRRHSEFLDETKQLVALQARLINTLFFASAAALAGVLYLWLAKSQGFGGESSTAYWILGSAVFFLVINVIVYIFGCQLQRRWAPLEKENEFDPITGSLNRQCFEERLDDEIRRASRYHYPLTLCRLDIDDFESYKKSFGANKAKELLREFSENISGTIRDTDTLARYEDDEFCILLPHTDLVQGEKFVARLLKAISQKVDCTFSAGVTHFRAGENKTELMMRGQSALVHAKQEGKQRICCVIGNDDHQALVQF